MVVSAQDLKACMALVQERMACEVPRINNGGCAVFAAELLKRMYAVNIFNANVRVFGEQFNGRPNICDLEDHLRSNNCNTLDEWNWRGVSFAHVVVEWDGKNWDGIETFEGDQWKLWGKYPGFMSLETVEELADQRGWNMMFNRADIPRVRRILDECFELLTVH